jgi:Domain of unknown function (DUF4411)
VIYVFDTSSFRVLRHYYPERFPSLWAGLDELIGAGTLISTREVLNELERFDDPEPMLAWARSHREIFATPTNDETEFVARIFQVQHFQNLIARKSILIGSPVADPFVIAAAATKGNGAVVTQEGLKENAAKIPNVCQHFGIRCMNLEEFMAQQNWNF